MVSVRISHLEVMGVGWELICGVKLVAWPRMQGAFFETFIFLFLFPFFRPYAMLILTSSRVRSSLSLLFPFLTRHHITTPHHTLNNRRWGEASQMDPHGTGPMASMGGELGPFGGDGLGGFGPDAMAADGGFSEWNDSPAMGFEQTTSSSTNEKNALLAAGTDADKALRGFTSAGAPGLPGMPKIDATSGDQVRFAVFTVRETGAPFHPPTHHAQHFSPLLQNRRTFSAESVHSSAL